VNNLSFFVFGRHILVAIHALLFHQTPWNPFLAGNGTNGNQRNNY
jgi:hypothetical protein